MPPQEALKFSSLQDFRRYDVRQKLHSNWHPIVPGERSELSRLLFSAEEDLEKYDVEIARLHARIYSLKNDQTELKEHVRLSKSFLSPMRRIPRDVWVEVFTQLNVIRGGIKLVEPKPIVPLLSASRTCTFWRKTIISTPSLWSQIEVDGMLLHSITFSLGLRHILLYSRGSPLDICISDLHERQEDRGLAFLFDSSNRLETLSLKPYPGDLQLYRGLKDRVPSLKTLLVDYEQLEEDEADFALFSNAPKLSNLTLKLPMVSDSDLESTKIPSLPWEQLEKMTLVGTNMLQAREILSRCQNLSSLDLSVQLAGALSHTRKRITLPKLKILSITIPENLMGHNSHLFTLRQIFDAFVLPSLEDLKMFLNNINFTGLRGFTHSSSFLGLIFESNFPLSHFTMEVNLSEPADETEHYDPLLQISRLPSLTHLNLRENTFGNPHPLVITTEVLQKLTVSTGPTRVLRPNPFDVVAPNLKELKLKTNHPHINHRALLDMIQSRMGWNADANQDGLGVEFLELVELDFGYMPNNDILQQYRHLKFTGIDLRVHVTGLGQVV